MVMYAPRRCPVCGKIATFGNRKITVETKHHCDGCDTEFPVVMMPPTPSIKAIHRHRAICSDDIVKFMHDLDDSDKVWLEITRLQHGRIQ